jgi:hypothetical protein
MAIRPKHSGLTWTKIRKVFLMTKAGGNPIEEIKKTPGAEDQYRLLMYQKFKAMGLDRPTIHAHMKINDEKRIGFTADYAAGKPVKEICKTYNVSSSAVYHNGVISRKPPARTPEMKAEVLQMYDSGKTCNEIARHFEVHHNVVRHIILVAHPEMKSLSNKPFVRLTQEKTDEVLKMFQEGMIIGHIAKLTGHSKTTIERIVGHVPSRSYKKNNAETLDKLHTAWTLGEGLGATARKLNMAKSTVKFHFDKFKRDPH